MQFRTKYFRDRYTLGVQTGSTMDLAMATLYCQYILNVNPASKAKRPRLPPCLLFICHFTHPLQGRRSRIYELYRLLPTSWTVVSLDGLVDSYLQL